MSTHVAVATDHTPEMGRQERVLTGTASRYGFIDGIRGIAACLVMVQHSLYQSGLLGGHSGDRLAGFIPTWLELGETGVVAFFLVSGFVIPLSLERTRSSRLFWIHRALRIYPLYIAAFIATFALTGGGGITTPGQLSAHAAGHLLFAQEFLKQHNFVAGSWTLSLEAVWYVSVFLLYAASAERRIGLLVGGSVAVSALAGLACAGGHHVPMGRLSMLLCCVVGLICFRREQRLISANQFAIGTTVMVLTIALNLFAGMALFPSPTPTSSFPMAFDSWTLGALVFAVPFLCRKAPVWNTAAIGYLGRISYSVYLVHPIVLCVLAKTDLSGIDLVSTTVVLTLAISTVSYQFIEAPFIRLGHSLKTRRGSTPTRARPAPAA